MNTVINSVSEFHLSTMPHDYGDSYAFDSNCDKWDSYMVSAQWLNLAENI